MSTTKTKPAPLHYFRTNTRPRRGDIIATCRMGQCRVIRITPDRMLRVRNIITNEVSFEYADECDLIRRKTTPEKDAEETEEAGYAAGLRHFTLPKLDRGTMEKHHRESSTPRSRGYLRGMETIQFKKDATP